MSAEEDAILVGRVTDEREHPQLTVRHWSGPNPKRLVLTGKESLADLMNELYNNGIQSLIVEGGAHTHQSFLDACLWDEIRVETAPITVYDGTKAPSLPTNAKVVSSEHYGDNVIRWFEGLKD